MYTVILLCRAYYVHCKDRVQQQATKFRETTCHTMYPRRIARRRKIYTNCSSRGVQRSTANTHVTHAHTCISSPYIPIIPTYLSLYNTRCTSSRDPTRLIFYHTCVLRIVLKCVQCARVCNARGVYY